jgi:hypothetical protein
MNRGHDDTEQGLATTSSLKINVQDQDDRIGDQRGEK